jgi:integrase
MARAGAPMRMIQAWMGHANITTTEIYANFSPDPTEGAAWAAKAFSAPEVASPDAVPVL